MLINREKLIMFQNLSLIHIDLPAGPAICYKEHSQKLTPYLLQNDVVLYFESCWKRENVANINSWDFNKLNDQVSQWKKSNILRLTN